MCRDTSDIAIKTLCRSQQIALQAASSFFGKYEVNEIQPTKQ
jgi:hypothetical protein